MTMRKQLKSKDVEEDDGEKNANPYTGPDWEWSSYDQFEDKRGKTTLKKQEKKSTDVEDGPFRVIYRRKKLQLWPDMVEVTLYSAPLIQIIQRYRPNDGELKSAAEPQVAGRHLFVMLDDLNLHASTRSVNLHDHAGGLHDSEINVVNGREGGGSYADPLSGIVAAGDDSDGGAAEGKQHLAHLVRFLEGEYGASAARIRRMKDEKRASFDLLWAILPGDSKVIYRCETSGKLVYAVVSANYYLCSASGFYFLIELDVWDYDGQRYRKCQIQRHIPKYEGERSFSSLAVCPADTFEPQETMETKLRENGRRFYDLGVKESSRFMHYTGPMFRKRRNGTCWQVAKQNADGRVMIDLASFAKMNPDYPMGTAEAPTTSFFTVGGRRLHGSGNLAGSEHATDLKDVAQNLIFGPAIVYGFSFSLKQWGAFAVSGFADVCFDSASFHELVMEPNLKQLIHKLVSQYIDPPRQESALHGLKRVDPISRKGEGCVFLCYGPPGSGKTLTAESLAENMRRPLWALSVSELGTTPRDLEQTLVKVMDIASTWRAVLLLDEADVYLEKRTSQSSVKRNAMTGVFLRLLEYYKGVLFLTTNRIATFDEAFRSRISMFVPYRKLGKDHKKQVWTNLLTRAGVQGVTPAYIADFAAEDLNGREIRNVIHTALVWANSSGEAATESHVKYVVDVTKSSLETLGKELAMNCE